MRGRRWLAARGRVRFLPCFWLVVEYMQVAIPDLQEINVAGDDLRLEIEGELVMAVIGEIGCREINGYFDRNGYGIVYEHETLQSFMPLNVIERCGQDQRGHARCMIFFALYPWAELRWEFGGTVLCLGE